MSFARRTLVLGAKTVVQGVLTLLAAATAGPVLNWAMLLFGLGSTWQAPGGVDPFSYGILILVLGILFPTGWLFAAQPYAVKKTALRVFRQNRDEVGALLVRGLERDLGDRFPASAEQLAEAAGKIRASVEEYPGPVRPLIPAGAQAGEAGGDRGGASRGDRASLSAAREGDRGRDRRRSWARVGRAGFRWSPGSTWW